MGIEGFATVDVGGRIFPLGLGCLFCNMRKFQRKYSQLEIRSFEIKQFKKFLPEV
jgi:hypothetical protein